MWPRSIPRLIVYRKQRVSRTLSELLGGLWERAFAQSDRRIYALRANVSNPKREFLDNYLSVAHRDHPGSGCVIAALGSEIARDSVARKKFTQRVKHMIEGMAGRFRWKRKDASRRNSICLLAAAVGALTLARAVDDPRLSDEILESVRDSLSLL
jgi:TetR/AcrR family transcriptional regulator, transcriptional repressor for nem operon